MARRQKIEDEDIVILYVEDDPDTLETYLDYIRSKWSPRSEGVRSLYGAMQLVERESFRPDLVIHDCQPLRRDGDDADNRRAGDQLYALFVRRKFPVVVLSGATEEATMQREPYRSNPPLSWLSKPISREHFDDAVKTYREWTSQGKETI